VKIDLILSGISALWPGRQTFLSEEHLKKFANAYSVSENDLKHETLLAKNLLRKESQLPTSLEQFMSFIAPYKAAFDCLYKFLQIALTLPVTSASCERIFSKIKLVTLSWCVTKLHCVEVDMKFWRRRCRDLCENRIAHCLFG